MTRCAGCPVPDSLVCVAVQHRRFCELVETREDYRATVLRLSTGQKKVVTPAPQGVDPVSYAQAAKIETCDFRRSSCGCLYKPAVCLQFGYAGPTTFDQCSACVSASG